MNDDREVVGGIGLKEVIAFQTKIMMGQQYERIKNAQDEKDIIIACLRTGWNDAFRHTSKNKKNGEKSVLELNNAAWKKREGCKGDYDDYICGEILSRDVLLNSFDEFSTAVTIKEKTDAIENSMERLRELFKEIKETEGDRKLCFGHFQKMFNIALKLYLCLYLCRDFLELEEALFKKEIIGNYENAHCPVDSIILEKLDEKLTDENSKFSLVKWSRLGTEDNSVEKYGEIQKKITELSDGKSNLYFDFKSWN